MKLQLVFLAVLALAIGLGYVDPATAMLCPFMMHTAAATIAPGAGAGTAAAGAASGAGTVVEPGSVAVVPVAGEGGAPDTKWLGDTAAEDVRGYASNKGWKGPLDVVDGYRNLEKLVGAHRLALPKDENDADGWNKTYDALGRPKTAAEYKIETPAGGDGVFTKTAADWMHKAGLNTRQAQALAKSWNEHFAASEKAAEERYATDSGQAMEKLKETWGGAYNERIETAKRAARTFGIDQTMADRMERGLGTSGFMDLMWRIGHALGEHKGDAGLGDTRPGSGALTPEQAKGEIERLKGDREWSKSYANGDAEKRKRMDQLHAWAFPPGT
jgi:hypothetical protein